MKKTWWIVALSLLGVGLVLLIASFATNGFQFKLPGVKTVSLDTKTYEVKEDFDKLDFDLKTGDLELLVSEDGGCRVECGETDGLHYEVEVKGDTLTVRELDDRGFADKLSLFGDNHKVTAYLPKTAYEALKIEISTGDVKIPKDFSFAQIECEGNTSGIDCAALSIGTASFKTTTGDIRLKGCMADRLVAGSHTGDITLEELTAAALETTVTTGDVTLRSVTVQGQLDAGVSTGALEIRDTVAGTINAKAGTGDIRFENSDADEIHAKATTGSISGSLRTPKIFLAEASTGSVDVPKTTTGGVCELTTTTGSIHIVVSG